jgi:YbbR domain-containing protein
MRLADSLKANIGLKLLALFMATALWYAATQGRVVEEILSVPVVMENIPAHLAVAEQPPPVVQVMVAGQGTTLRMQDLAGLKAVLDLKGLGPGTATFDSQAAVKLRSGLRVERVQPSRIELRLVNRE